MLDIIESLLPVITVILSAVVSVVVSRLTSIQEIKKFTLESEREDNNQFKELFSLLMQQTDAFCSYKCNGNKSDAIKTNAKLISYAPDEIIPLLKELDIALTNKDVIRIKAIREELMTVLKP